MSNITFIEDAMRICIELAKESANNGDYPNAAAIVSKKEGVIASAGSGLIKGNDPTAHPEIIVLREASEIKSSRYLNDLYLVSTLEPCPMCTSASIWAKLAGIAYGTSQRDAIEWGRKLNDPKYTFRQIDIECQSVVDKGSPKLDVIAEVLKEECNSLMKLVG